MNLRFVKRVIAMGISLVDEQRQGPDHRDDDDILIGIIQQNRGCEEEDDGGQRQENKKRKSLLQFLFPILLFAVLHN